MMNHRADYRVIAFAPAAIEHNILGAQSRRQTNGFAGIGKAFPGKRLGARNRLNGLRVYSMFHGLLYGYSFSALGPGLNQPVVLLKRISGAIAIETIG